MSQQQDPKELLTSSVMPPACPACALSFNAIDPATIAAHLIAHLVVRVGAGSRTAGTADW